MFPKIRGLFNFFAVITSAVNSDVLTSGAITEVAHNFKSFKNEFRFLEIKKMLNMFDSHRASKLTSWYRKRTLLSPHFEENASSLI